jgi:hypothetical protein
VQGGHYRTAATCLAGKPVGLTGHDTAAYASADVEGQIDFDLQTTSADLKVIWQDMPPGARFAVLGPSGDVRTDIEISGTSTQVVPLNDSGRWHVRVSVARQLRAAGGSGRDQYDVQSVLLIALQ